MSTSIDFTWNKPVAKVIAEATGGKDTMAFMASEAFKHMDPYTPEATGTMKDNARIEDITDNSASIHYVQAYSADNYYNSKRRFRREKAIFAQAFWDKGMMIVKKGELVKAVQGFIKRGSV